MSVLITETNNTVAVSTLINSLENTTSSSTNTILTQQNNTNIEINSTPNNININNNVLIAADITDLNEAIDDRVGQLLTPGSNIELNYNDISNNLTISATGLLTPLSIIKYPQLSNDIDQSINITKRTAKAWINFNGTGTVSIRSSFGISSIIDNGIGDYTINFTVPFINTNYTFVTWARDYNTDNTIINNFGARSNTTKTTSSIRLIYTNDNNAVNYDSPECNIIFFGD